MRTILVLTVILGLLLATAGSPAAASSSWHLSGGGTADISQVAVNVRIDGSGHAKGSFLCLMAGRSAFAIGGFGLAHNMIVHATPTSGSVSGTVVTFSGRGRLILDGAEQVGVDIQVSVDVATRTFQLTVFGVATLPVETLLTGALSLR